MDFPTDEDLYEMQHQDELDALNELDQLNNDEYDDFDPFSFGVKNKPPSSKQDCSFNESRSQEKTSKSSEYNGTVINHKSSENNLRANGIEADKNSGSSSQPLGKPPAKRKLLEYLENIEREFDFVPENRSVSPESIVPSKRKKTCDVEEDFDATKITIPSSAVVEHPIETVPVQRASHALFSSLDSSTFPKETVTLTRSDGRRVHLGIKKEDDESFNIPNFAQQSHTLLDIPIDSLKSKYFLLEEQSSRDCEIVSVVNNASVDLFMDCENEESNKENSLWVDKYRPVSYTHLLSEEGINRTMLQWLKLWDKVVFGKEKKAKKKPTVDPNKPAKFQKKWGELVEDLDEHGRPYHKVAFLCGPPGLGKTTLATIIARHAGYNVVELNASDDRNPEAFRTSLEAATQMKSVLHEDHRPNCLILDEIDGAPAASINVLLSFIKSIGIPKGAKRKKGDIPLLTRPLICICNDQYSAALKPLKQLALVLNFPSTAVARLASRLHEVSSKEGLVADIAVLTKLCEKTCNDIRSCLSTLQFIHNRQNELKVSDIEKMQIGQKDMQKSLFGVWQDIFYFQHKKSFTSIHQTVQAYGDYDKVFIGMFENYANIKFKQRNLDALWLGSEWTCFGDIIQQQIAQRQLFFLLPYLPYPAVAFHMLFASNSFPQLSYPSAFYEHRAKVSQMSNTLSSMIKDMITSLKTFLNPGILLLDVFPFLVEIIKPNLRPVNTQLYSEREKKELHRVIELMLAFNLNYHQERAQDGTYNYVLEPNIEELIKFSDIKTKKVLTYSAKQLIAREVEMELMRKGDSKADEKAVKVTKNVVKQIPEAKPFLKKAPAPEKPVLDFFGRQIIQKPKETTQDEKTVQEEEVWFHFKEGYSNAVRKTVYIRDLL